MSQKVEIEIGVIGKERFSKEFSDCREEIGKIGSTIDSLKQKSDELIGKFSASVAEADRLRNELKQTAESGAGIDELIAKAKELGEAQKKAANDGAEAMAANQKYWTALLLAGEDIKEVQSNHIELGKSYTEISSQAERTNSIVKEYSRRLEEEKVKLQDSKEKTDEARISTEKIAEAKEKASKSSKNFADKLGEVSNSARGIPGPIGDSISSVNGLTRATLRFIATPLGATLAVISAALAMVTSWFKRTEEGQNAMAVGSAYFTQVLNSLLDVADNVGEWLYKAFTKPKSALTDLVNFIKGQVINRIKAVGEMAQGIWMMLNGDFSEGFNKFSNGWMQGMTGVQDVTGKISSWMSDTNKKAERRMEISRRQNELDRRERENLVERAKLESRINQLREKAYDKNVPEKERSKAVKEAQELTTKMYDQEIGLARERYEIIRDTNKLSHSNKEDKRKEAEAEAELYRLESQRATAQKGLMREQNRVDSSLKRSGNEQAKANAKVTKQELEFQDNLLKLKQDAIRAQEDATIASIRNASERERAERDIQHKRTIADIKAQENDIYKSIYEQRKKSYENSHSGKSYENTSAGAAGWQGVKGTLTDEEKRYYDERYKVITASLEKENAEYARLIQERYKQEAQVYLDYIKEYGSFQDQRAAITREYDQKIADETNAVQIAALEKQKQQALEAIDMEELKKSLDWETVFNDIERQSSKALESLKEKLRDALKGGDVSAENAKVLAEKIREIEDLLSKRKDPFSAWLPGLRMRLQLTNQVKEAEDKVAASAKNMLSLTAKSNKDLLEIQQDIFAISGKTIGLGDISKMTTDDYLKLLNLDPLTDAGRQAAERFESLKLSTVDLQKAQENLTQAQKDAKARSEALENFKNGGSVGQYFKDVTQGFDFGQWASYINMNAQSLADFTDKIGLAGTDFGDAVHGFAEGVGGFNAAIQSLASGDIFGALGGIVDGFAGIGKMIDSIGGGFLFGNDDEYEAALDKWGWVLDSWEDNIRYERELMEKAYGAKAIEAAEKAIEDAKNAAEAAKNIYEGWAGSGAGWFSHSNGYNVNEGVRWDLLYNYNKDLFAQSGGSHGTYNIFGRDYESFDGDVSKLFNLTWQELEKLKNDAPQFWASIHSEAQKYLDQYIEAGKAAEEALDALNEKLTTTTKENVFDDFLNSLYDLANGSKDVMENIAKNWQQMVNQMVINNFIGADLKDDLEGWYDALSQLQKDRANGLSNEEYLRRLEELKKNYNDYVNDAEGKMQEFIDLGIIKPIDEAAAEVSSTVESMTSTIKSAFSELFNDTEVDMEEWSKNLRNSIIRNLIESTLLGAEFEDWVKQWSEKFNEVWNAYNNGDMSKEAFEEAMAGFDSEMDGMTNTMTEKIKAMMETLGYSFGGSLSSPFSNLRDTFLDTLTNMEDDAEAFKKRLEEIMVKDLIEKQVLDVPITVNGMPFDNFAAYVEDWNKRYADAVKSGNQEAIDALIQELVEVRKMTVEAAEELRERLKEATEDTTFKGMADSWVSTLMDMSKTAEDWAQDVGKTMAEKIIKEMLVAEYMQPLLNNLQNAFDTALAAEGATVQSIIAAVTPFLNEISEAFPQLQELVKGIMDALGVNTSVSGGFSDLRSTFVSTLTDMQSDAATFGKNIAITMLQQMMDEFVKKKYQSQLDEISSKWRDALNAGDTEAMELLRIEILKLYEAMENNEAIKKFRDDLFALTNEAQTPFDNMRDSFRSALMDMSKSAKDFTKDISQMIAEDFINEFVMGTAFDEKLAQWKKRYKSITSDGNLTEEQRLEQLKQLAGLISNERDALTEQTRNILNLLGLGQHEDQAATMNMAEAATYDQFELYLGMETSHLMVAEQTKGIVQQILNTLQSISGITAPNNESYTKISEAINKCNNNLLLILDVVRSIEGNVKTNVEHVNYIRQKL